MKISCSKSFSRIIAYVISLTLVLTTVFVGATFATESAGSGDDVFSGLQRVDLHPSATSPSGYIDPGIDATAINSANYSDASDGITSLAALPTSFDLRTTTSPKRYTPVRDQGNFGACWAFATLASAESSESLNLLNGTADPVVLSPYHLAWAGYNAKTFSSGGNDPLGLGGNSVIATAAMSKGFGPEAETQYPYPSSQPSTAISLTNLNKSAYILSDTSWLPTPMTSPTSGTLNSTNMTAIKNAIYNKGAVYVSYDAGPNGIASAKVYPEATDGTHSYFSGTYFAPSYQSDHAVTIVGWDDTYPKTNFNYGGVPDVLDFASQPPNNGAFLIKNSWGTSFGDAGYFWMSYFEPTIREIAILNITTKPADNNIYYYDDLGYGTSLSMSGISTLSMANIFPVNSANAVQSLNSVSFYTITPNTSYQVTVYTNSSATNPTSGTKALSVAGTQTFAGYHTVSLPNPPHVRQGEKYSAVVKLTAPSGQTVGLPLETKSNPSDYLSVAANQSFVSLDGTSWDDVYTSLEKVNQAWENCGNFCIKASATDITPQTATITKAPAATQIAGFPINLSGGSLYMTYSDGSEETVAMNAPGVNISPAYNKTKLGTQILTVSYDGVSAGTITVNVIPATTSVSATLTSGNAIPTIYQYNSNSKTHTISLKAKAAPSGSQQTFTWSVSGPAKVSTAGVVTFTGAEGTVKVTAKAKDGTGKSKTYTIKSVKHVTKISSVGSTIYMKKSSTLSPTFLPLDSNLRVSAKLTYKSSNTKVFTVSSAGKLTSKSVNKKTKATLTVTAANGLKKSYTIYVVPKASSVKKLSVSGSPTTLKVGALKQLSVKVSPTSSTNVKPTFKSSNNNVATVDTAGNIRAIKKGTAIITIKAGGKTVNTKKITVS
jgi:C1A family cysteine protease